jgi:AcrR family transcriptional regulator
MSERNPTYYDGDLRRELLDAAKLALAEQGASAVSLRSVARAVGVSHAAPAHYFTDKTGLFTDLAAEGLALLADILTEQVELAGDDPVEGLTASGVAYVEFSQEHPGYFEVMFRRDLIDLNDPTYAESGVRALTVLTEAVAACQAAGWGRGEEAWVLTDVAWAAMHGVASLSALGVLGRPASSQDTDSVAAAVTRALSDAFRSR